MKLITQQAQTIKPQMITLIREIYSQNINWMKTFLTIETVEYNTLYVMH